MKNIFNIFIVVMFFAVSTSVAQINWTKDPNNPVLEPGPPGAWDGEWVFLPGVLFDGSIYQMWYTGYDLNNVRIGYATSSDGINWTRLPNPVLEGMPNTWAEQVAYASVINDGTNYHMWFHGDSANINRIGYATSPDGILWTKHPDPVLDIGSPGSWDSLWVIEPKVIFENATFHMWYTGWDGGNAPRIGYATSPDGINWTKYDDPATENPPYAESDPVMNPGDPGSWDAATVCSPVVIYDGNIHHMWYEGGDTLTPGMPWAVTGKIGYASSPDGITWTKFNNPVLEPGTGSDWDNVTLGVGDVVYNNNNYQMWYSGGGWDGTFRYRIGYAMAQRFPAIIQVPGDYPTIQAGINAAIDGDTVLVADSTYYENINFKGKAITVASHFYIDSDTSHISNTIIDGSQPTHPDTGTVVSFVSGEDTNSVLTGFTITGGTGTNIYYGGDYMRIAGGIHISHSGAKIEHNKIWNNVIQTSHQNRWSAGIEVFSESINDFAIIKHNVIKNNAIISNGHGGGGGVGMYSLGTIVFESNIVCGNSVTASNIGWGGGMCCDGYGGLNGTFVIKNNLIKNNHLNAATARGGGFFIRYLNPQIYNNIITNNSVNGYGGGLYINGYSVSCEPELINNTIIENQGTHGGGIYNYGANAHPKVINSILWGNIATIVPSGSQIYVASGNISVRNSDIQGGWTGTGNINSDPCFCDSICNMVDTSLCIGAGTDSVNISGTWYYAPSTDFDGDPRPNPVDMYVDIGAQESPYPNPTGIIKEDSDYLPKTFSLKQNYPNPFNPRTNIQFSIPKSEYVTLKIYNLLGQEVATLVSKKLIPGNYKYTWDASQYASGVYFYKLEAGSFVKTKKLILLK